MNAKKFWISGLVGGVVSFFVGFAIYGIALAKVMDSSTGTATNVMRGPTEMVYWSIMLGSLFMGLTLAYIFAKANINTVGSGMVVGAIAGFLIIAGHDFTSFGTSNLFNMNGLLIDVCASTVMQAITGAAIGFVNSKIRN
jgi:uncharacterized membrane protein